MPTLDRYEGRHKEWGQGPFVDTAQDQNLG